MHALIQSFSRKILADNSYPGVVVLMYHRIWEKHNPLLPGELDLNKFKNQLKILKDHFNVLSALEAFSILYDDSITDGKKLELLKNAVVITIDDGHLENLTVTLPILKHFDMPSSLFVTSGHLHDAPNVRLPYTKALFADVVYEIIKHTSEPYFDPNFLTKNSNTDLPLISLKSVIEKSNAIKLLSKLIKYNTIQDRKSLLDQLQHVLKVDPIYLANIRVMLESSDLRTLDSNRMYIGGHTVNHPILTTLTDAECLFEIGTDKEKIESIIGRKLTEFAYPNGKSKTDFNEIHTNLVKQCGYNISFSTDVRTGIAYDDRFAIPRLSTSETGLKFLMRLNRIRKFKKLQ